MFNILQSMRPIALAMSGLLVASSAVAAVSGILPTGLRCEYRVNPLGIDVRQPRLSWTLGGAASERGLTQSAWRVLVASVPEKLARDQGDLWDSGKVNSDQQVHIEYAGKPLTSGTRCYWKVRVWDQSGQPSGWSEPATWSIGLLEPSDWKAEWIAATSQVEGPHVPRVVGYHAKEAVRADETRWVQVDLGAEHVIEDVKLYPTTPAGFEHVKGFGFPIRFRIDVSSDPNFHEHRTIVALTQEDYPSPGDEFRSFAANGVRGRYVRVTGTKLWKRDYGPAPFCFALGEMEVFSGGKNIALRAPVRAQDSVELYGWSITRLTDGQKPVTSSRGKAPYRPERTKAQREGQGAAESDHPPYAAVLMRREINLPKQPVRATAYLSGLGYHELFINGRKVGDHVLDPGFTDYTKRVLYVTHDVSNLLPAGRNAIGVMLGGGWYDSPAMDVWGFHTAPWIAPPKLLLRIDVEYGDGTRDVIVSDTTWKHSTGPIVFNSIRSGETYDARRKKPGWDRTGYDDSAWPAAVQAHPPAGRLMAQFHPPIRVVESIRPVALTEPKSGVYVFDLGVNIAGWARLETRGKHGQKITLAFNELLNKDGTVNVAQNADLTRGRFQTGEFILKGEGFEAFEPRFTYHGFRYVQITGLSEKPTLDSLTGRWVHTDLEPAGSFSCSNPLVNRIHEMIRRTQLNNLHGIPTDCPQREKVGWTEDGCVTMEEAIHNFQMATFYTKWLRDMLDAQDDNGHASCIAPSPGWGKSEADGSPSVLSDPWWGGAIVRTPWQLYRYYGDRRILEEAYPAMKRYMDYVARYAPGQIAWGHEGDWLEVGSTGFSQRTPPQLAGTAAYCYYAKIVAEIARMLGRDDEPRKYSRLAEDISVRFQQRFFDTRSALYAKDSQTAQALPLAFGITPPDKRPLVLDQLLKNIREKHRDHISSGIVGTLYVFQTLMESGHDDVAYAMLTREDFPGWGHMLKSGATTVWEAWDGGGSRNHPALGCIDAWLYQGPGGIRLDPAIPAFKRIVIKPAIVGDLTWVKCSYRSIHGRIECNWRREGGNLHLDVTIPVNTTAVVHVPTARPETVTESGRAARQADGVKRLRVEKGEAVYEVGSGSYRFEAPFPG